MPYAALEKEMEKLNETQLVVAQAQAEGLAIVTRDRLIPQYPVQTVW